MARVSARRLWAPWILAVPLVCFSLACGDDSPAEAFELSGYVRDATTEDGISGADVVFVSDTLFIAETETDGDGFYEMVVETDRPFGQVRANADGFSEGETTVFFDAPSRRVDLRLRPASGD